MQKSNDIEELKERIEGNSEEVRDFINNEMVLGRTITPILRQNIIDLLESKQILIKDKLSMLGLLLARILYDKGFFGQLNFNIDHQGISTGYFSMKSLDLEEKEIIECFFKTITVVNPGKHKN